ncbi:MAG TPA: YncE family protein [Bryobacteraceae bacterium]|nr:YncE family protein [Bryobacteraceae bacterium]
MLDCRIGLVLALLSGAAGVLSAASLDPNNPTGNAGLVLIDKLGHYVRFFDPATFKEISSVEVGVTPHDLAISPDHKTVYTPVYGDGIYGRNPHPEHHVAIIDLATRKVTGMIDVSPYQAPHGIQIDDAGTLYVTCDLSRRLLVIDPQKRALEAAIDTEGTGHWLAVLPDGSKAYVTNKNDRPFVSVIDLKARKMIGRIPAPNGTEGIGASPDGKRVLVADHAEPVILVIDSATDTVIDKIAMKGNSKGLYKVRYTPDGSKVLAMNSSESLINVLSAANLHGDQHVLPVGKAPMGFAFTPDGKTALIANHGDGTVSVIDLQKSRVVTSFAGGTGIETLSYY